MKRICLSLAIVALLFSACTNNKQGKIDKIRELESVVNSKADTVYNVAKAKELADAYIDFAVEFPDDTAAATCYYNAARILMNNLNPGKAVEYFDKVIKDYPDYRRVAECMFLEAFTYDNFLKDINKAKEGYNTFISKYPNHEYADDARSLIEMLGKTPEQISAEFQEMQQNDTAGVASNK